MSKIITIRTKAQTGSLPKGYTLNVECSSSSPSSKEIKVALERAEITDKDTLNFGSGSEKWEKA